MIVYCTFLATCVLGGSKVDIFNELTTVTATNRTGTRTTIAMILQSGQSKKELTPYISQV
jgi:hypothetical protein